MRITPASDPPRIAVFGPTHPFKGGVAQHTTTLAHRLRERGAEVRVVSWSRPYPERLYPGQLTVDRPEMAVFEPVERSMAWNRPDTWIGAGRRARTVDAAVFAHVIPVQAVPYRAVMAALHPTFGRAGGGPKVAVICHNVLPHERHRGDRLLVGSLLDRADRVLTHSDAQAALAAELIGPPAVAGTKVVAASLPPFFPDAFAPRRPEPGVHRRLLFFGIVRPYKGLDVLMEALAAGPPDVRLRVAGEVWGGPGALEARAEDLGIADRVELVTRYIAAEEVPDLF